MTVTFHSWPSDNDVTVELHSNPPVKLVSSKNILILIFVFYTEFRGYCQIIDNLKETIKWEDGLAALDRKMTDNQRPY